MSPKRNGKQASDMIGAAQEKDAETKRKWDEFDRELALAYIKRTIDDAQQKRILDDAQQKQKIEKLLSEYTEKVIDRIVKKEDKDDEEKKVFIRIKEWLLWLLQPKSTKIGDFTTQVLPAIRVQYIKEWGNIINGVEFNDHSQKRAEAMLQLVKQFDEVLKEKQTREQKSQILNKLLWFFGSETVILFILIGLAWFKVYWFELKETTFDIIVSATILQVGAMLATVVINLYPSEHSDKLFDQLWKINEIIKGTPSN